MEQERFWTGFMTAAYHQYLILAIQFFSTAQKKMKPVQTVLFLVMAQFLPHIDPSFARRVVLPPYGTSFGHPSFAMFWCIEQSEVQKSVAFLRGGGIKVLPLYPLCDG